MPELMVALVVTAWIFLGMAGMAAISVQIKDVVTEQNTTDRDLRHLYIYFQKQIRQSKKLYVTQKGLCLEDMESRHLGYLNYYTYDEKTRVVYRHKIIKTGIPQGTKMQLASGIRCFSISWDPKQEGVKLQIEMDQGEEFETTVSFTGNIEVLPL